MPERFPERLRYVRQRKGLTLKQLEKITGIAYQQLCKYEKGHNAPTITVLEWICTALDVTSKELLGF